MPLQTIDGKVAFRSMGPSTRYPDPKKDASRYIPVPHVAHQAKFRINDDDKIFTIGSCFARNIELAMVDLGLRVISSFTPGAGGGSSVGAVSLKYSTKSILRDLLVAFDAPQLGGQTIYEVADGFVNLALGGSGAEVPLPRSDIESLTERYYRNFVKLRDADVVVMTLGLVEVWFDKETRCHLNIAPSRALIAKHPGRFELQVLSYSDIRADLDLIIARLKAVCGEQVKILITVSPVPLHATFRGIDVLQANMYSKCVQRAAVEDICCKYPEIAYFPSFEIVMLSAPKVAWVDDDFRHVRPQLVKQIMSSVLKLYLGDGYIAPEPAALKKLFSRRKFDEIISEVEMHLKARGIAVSAAPASLRYYYGCALDEKGEPQRALELMDGVIRDWGAHEPSLARRNKLAGLISSQP